MLLFPLQRKKALATIFSKRYDSEGSVIIDAKASHRPMWNRWRDGLNQLDRCYLGISEGGAAETPSGSVLRPGVRPNCFA